MKDVSRSPDTVVLTSTHVPLFLKKELLKPKEVVMIIEISYQHVFSVHTLLSYSQL
jgi:hypothetical protein